MIDSGADILTQVKMLGKYIDRFISTKMQRK